MRRVLPENVASETGMLDPAAIEEVVEQAWPDVRNADELHDTLLTVNALVSTAVESGRGSSDWKKFMDELIVQRRAGVAVFQEKEIWFAAERMRLIQKAYPDARITRIPAEIDQTDVSQEDAIWMIVRGWMAFCGPVRAADFADQFKLPLDQVEQALLRLESAGSVLRGNFHPTNLPTHMTSAPQLLRSTALEWCDRRLLARIHRLTLGSLRKQIEPVTAAQFMRWLFRWQHVAPGTMMRGERGLAEVMRQMQGFEIPARAWEPDILSRRVVDYQPSMLDQLCWSGHLGLLIFS
jgi:ATP-dependent Lhr-like helicase